MPQFAANLTMLFTETPFLDRFEKAHNSGFKAVEFLFPYPFAATEIKNKLDQYALKLVLHNLPAGDWDAGERGIACHPDRVAEFRAGGFRGPVYFMPCGGVESLYNLNAKNVAIEAMNRGYRYSDRLQVPLFKNEWGT